MNGTAAQYEADKILAELPDRNSDIIKPFARQTPDHPALVQGDVTWTYAELAAVVEDTTLILKFYDIRPGDRVDLAVLRGLGKLGVGPLNRDTVPEPVEVDRSRQVAALVY